MSQPAGRQPPKPGGSSGSGDGPVPGSAAPQSRKTGGAGSSAQQHGTEIQPGQVLGQYRVLARLGQGGMGAVYRAVHVHLDTPVALKILAADRLHNPEMVARFHREMRAVGRIEHPHLVRALDAGQVGNIHYLAMEFVDGLDLSRILRKTGPLPGPEACEIIRQAALGLQAIHAAGLVHRDIKPGNLMLARQPVGPPIVKILDLGLARLADSQVQGAAGVESLTASNVIVGTLDYMAPEQASHQTVDIRADIYSLGATLYALLAGKPPFSGPQYDSLISKLRALAIEDPPSIQTLRPDVPYELALVIERMLAKDPNFRYSTPQEVAVALEPFCTGADLAPLLDGKLPQHGRTPCLAAATPTLISGAAMAPVPPAAEEGVALRELIRRRRRHNIPPWMIVAGAVGAGAVAVMVLVVVLLSSSRRDLQHEAAQPPSVSPSAKDGASPSMPAPATKPTEPIGQRKPITWIIGRTVASIEEALARALDGDTIRIPAGQYELHAALVVNKRVTFSGDGRDRTIVSSNTPGDCIRVIASSVRIENLTLQYTGNQPANVVVIAGEMGTVAHCEIRGARAVNSSGIPPVTHGSGVLFINKASGSVVNCTFLNNGRAGITVTDAAKAQVTGNKIERCFDGVIFTESAGGLIADNHCGDCQSCGIVLVNAGPQVVVSGNTCVGNQQGIYIRNSPAILDSNALSSNKIHGLLIRGPAKPTLRRNLIQDNAEYGIWTDGVIPAMEPNNIFAGNKKGQVFPQGILASPKPPQSGFSPPVGSSQAQGPANPPQEGQPTVIRTWHVGKDAATLEQAVQQAQAGDIIVLPEGKYQLPRGLIVDKSLQIRGAGQDKTHVFCDAPDYVLKFAGEGSWTVEGLTLEHTGKLPASVVFVEAGKFTAQGCKFTGGIRNQFSQQLGYGLDIRAADSISISKCLVERNERAGISVTGKNDGMYLIEGCTILQCELGIVVHAGKCRINKCSAEKCRDCGIAMTGFAVGEVEGCTVRGNAQHGIVLHHRAQATVKNCQALNNGQHGIAAYGQTQADIQGNTCTGNGHFGVEYSDDARGLCQKNTCTLNRVGIGLGMRTTATVEENTCRQNREHGIWVREVARPTIRGNFCTANAGSGIELQGSVKPTIVGNRCIGNHRYGICIGYHTEPNIAADNQLVPNRLGPTGRRP
ncbi:Serine/threonine-protein kinase PknB [bacterium HR36]|nr:Serine/threonine-protein kinase PknB [bacterium HR36]